MKQTYFYSETQKQMQRQSDKNKEYIESYIKGEEYTETMTKEGEHKSNFNDAVIVRVKENLPVDIISLNLIGKKYAIDLNLKPQNKKLVIHNITDVPPVKVKETYIKETGETLIEII